MSDIYDQRLWVVQLVADEPWDLYRVQHTVTGILSRDSFAQHKDAKIFADKANRKERKHSAATNQPPKDEA